MNDKAKEYGIDEFKTPYAYIFAQKSGDYTHVYVRVINVGRPYNDLSNVTLEINSQGGGCSELRDYLYGFKHGIVGSGYGSIASLSELEVGVKVMRKVERRLAKDGYPSSNEGFAAYAGCVLGALGVKHFFYNPHFNIGFSGGIIEALPHTKSLAKAVLEIAKLEGKAIEEAQKMFKRF